MAGWEKCEGCGLKYYAEDGHKCQPSAASAGYAGWIATSEKMHPDKPGEKHYEQIPCLVVVNGEILIRQWNCEHLCWDTEDGDDFFCEPRKVTHWMPLPALPV